MSEDTSKNDLYGFCEFFTHDFIDKESSYFD